MSQAKSVTAYQFSDALPYLLARAGVRMGNCFGQELAAYGMTLDMYRVLASLQESDDQTLGALSASISNELSTMSRLVTRMKTRGWISRRRHTTDRRAIRIQLTATGRQLVLDLIPRAVFWEKVAVKGLRSREIKELKRMLKSVFDNIGERQPEPRALTHAFAGSSPGDPQELRAPRRRVT